MATKPPKPPKMPAHLCCVTINYQSFMLPSDKGRQLVALMESAIACKRTWRDGVAGRLFEFDDPHEVEYESVKPNQIVPSEGATKTADVGAPLALLNEPLKLEGRRS